MAAQDKGVLTEWRELESDPGLFSLLIEDYGVRGVKVEEVYDISRKLEGRVYGYVFLFRWGGERRARKKNMVSENSFVMDSDLVNRMFFALQIVNNSCATHALLSVLLNCHDIDLGPSLSRLKEFSADLDPESKGLAIANMVELAQAHNRHSKPLHTIAPPPGGRRGSVVSSAHALLPETYHFVSYVPINDRLFELDGLKEFPIDHGPWGEEEEWTDLFRRIISQRLASAQDILFNLMAVVPDLVPQFSEQLQVLQQEQKELLDLAVKLAEGKKGDSIPTEVSEEEIHRKEVDFPNILGEVAKTLPEDCAELRAIAKKDITEISDEKLKIAIARVVVNDQELELCKQKLKEEVEKKQRYRIEFSRRTFDYDPLITAFLKALAQNGQLPARLMRKPSNSQSVSGQRRGSGKHPQGRVEPPKNKKPRTTTTLLVNGSKVT